MQLPVSRCDDHQVIMKTFKFLAETPVKKAVRMIKNMWTEICDIYIYIYIYIYICHNKN